MNKATIKWLASAPSWNKLAQEKFEAFNRPEILQFINDEFMQELLSKVQQQPIDLSAYDTKEKKSWRNWRGEELTRLKLYQPAHQRHYLVTACLVCQMPGLPDRHVETGRKESVGFVLRRLLPATAGTPSSKVEFALVTNTPDPTWTQVLSEGRSSEDVLVPGEEILPLFPIYYAQENGYRRRLYAGNIPVAKREIYENSFWKKESSTATNPAATDAKTARKAFFQTQIIAPWRSLVENAELVKTSQDGKLFGSEPNDAQKTNRTNENNKLLKAAREQIQTGSWYILLDFAKYLKKYMSTKMVDAIEKNSDRELDDRHPEKLLFERLGKTTLPADLAILLTGGNDKIVKTNLRDALKAVLNAKNEPNEHRNMLELEDDLDKIDVPYPIENPEHPWPKFLFPFADPEYGGILPDVDVALEDRSNLNKIFNKFLDYIDAALPTDSTLPVPVVPLSAQLSSQGRPEVTDGIYVIRCVYSRPECQPLKTDILSEPTQEFQLASFFDPDAPGRPIRITLPEDPTPAGLRKYAKNTAFMISDVLCGQMNAMKKVTFGDLVLSVLPWPFHKDLPISAGDMKPCRDNGNTVGRVCSLSIPIITICAMFLLMMIVIILDFVFRWIPWFITCFPLPNFRSKK